MKDVRTRCFGGGDCSGVVLWFQWSRRWFEWRRLRGASKRYAQEVLGVRIPVESFFGLRCGARYFEGGNSSGVVLWFEVCQ